MLLFSLLEDVGTASVRNLSLSCKSKDNAVLCRWCHLAPLGVLIALPPPRASPFSAGKWGRKSRCGGLREAGQLGHDHFHPPSIGRHSATWPHLPAKDAGNADWLYEDGKRGRGLH